MPPLELWGGTECTVNRTREGYRDQTILKFRVFLAFFAAAAPAVVTFCHMAFLAFWRTIRAVDVNPGGRPGRRPRIIGAAKTPPA